LTIWHCSLSTELSKNALLQTVFLAGMQSKAHEILWGCIKVNSEITCICFDIKTNQIDILSQEVLQHNFALVEIHPYGEIELRNY